MKSALLYSAACNAFKKDDAIRLVKELDPSLTVSAFRCPMKGEQVLDDTGRGMYTAPGTDSRSRWIVVNDVPKTSTPEERIAASKGDWTWQGWTVETLAVAGKRVIDFRIPKPGETIVNASRGSSNIFLLKDTRKWFLNVPIIEDIESPQMQAAKRWAAKNNCKVVGVGATKGQYCLSNWSDPDLDTSKSTDITTVVWSPAFKHAFRVEPLEGYVFEKHAKEPNRFVSVPVVKAVPIAPAKPVLVANVDDFAAHLKAAITEYFKGSVLDGGSIAERTTKLAVDSLLESALLGVKERKLTREQCLALGLGKEARAAQCRVQCGYGK